MKNFFSKNLNEALNYRKQTQLTNSRGIILSVIIFVFVYAFLAYLLHPSEKDADYHFYSERGLITALSVIFISMAGTFSLTTLVIHVKENIPDRWSWVLISTGFFFLALDETAQFHERLGNVLDEQIDSGAFRNWNDIIVILYGVIALPFIAVFLPSLIRYKMVLELFVTAFGFYVIHTFVDSTFEPATISSRIVEETAKLFCGAFLAMSTLFSFLGALKLIGIEREH